MSAEETERKVGADRGETETRRSRRGTEKRSPAEWAKKLGHVDVARDPLDGLRESARYDAWHAAADVLHGWSLHEYHEAEPMTLTRGDYEAAIEAATVGVPEPHKAALSKHCPHDFGG